LQKRLGIPDTVAEDALRIYTQTVKDIRVEDESVTELQVKLFPKNTKITDLTNPVRTEFSISPYHNGIRILCNESDYIERMTIYDLSGKKIWSCAFNAYPAKSSVLWNGTDNTGRQVGKGCYLVRLGTRQRVHIIQFVRI